MNSETRVQKTRHPLVAPAAGLAAGAGVLLALNAQLLAAQFYLFSSPPVAASHSVVAATPTPVQVSPEPKILIQKIGVEAPVIFDMDRTDNASVQRSLQDGVLQFADSALPGQKGNIVIVGHSSNVPWAPGNYKFIFTHLEQLQKDDQIILHYRGIQYVYKITGTKTVSPTDVSVLAQTDTPQLTLVTCTPVGTNRNRFIVSATQVSPDPATATDRSNPGASEIDPRQTLPGQGATALQLH